MGSCGRDVSILEPDAQSDEPALSQILSSVFLESAGNRTQRARDLIITRQLCRTGFPGILSVVVAVAEKRRLPTTPSGPRS